MRSHFYVYTREFELITEAHAQLFVVRNSSRSSLRVCVGGGETAGERGEVSSSGGVGGGDSTQGERIWNSFGRQKVRRGLLLIIYILWCTHFGLQFGQTKKRALLFYMMFGLQWAPKV